MFHLCVRSGSACAFHSESVTQNWCIAQNPASDRRMIQAESPLGHHLFQVPIAERIAQIRTKAEDDDLVLKVSSSKQRRPRVLHSFTLPECTQRVCDRSFGCGSRPRQRWCMNSS